MTSLNKWQVGRAAAVGGVAAYSKLAVLFKGGAGGAAKLAAAGAAAAGAAVAASSDRNGTKK
jgi:hypothetical protein